MASSAKYNQTFVIGVDVGNSTTEGILTAHNSNGVVNFVAHAICETTGVKGTTDNLPGVMKVVDECVAKAELTYADIDRINLNNAAPVIGKLTTDTISETNITGSAMIGHNPDTPGGHGLAMGITIDIRKTNNLASNADKEYIVLIDREVEFDQAANMINQAQKNGIKVVGAIAQKDDGVLIVNRLDEKIPVVDEVYGIDKIEEGLNAAIEVAENGKTVQVLSNPYGIAGQFGLNAEETAKCVPIARSLMGSRSGVVIRSENAVVENKKIEAGTLKISGVRGIEFVDVNSGAEKIMKAVDAVGTVTDVTGSEGSNAKKLFDEINSRMAEVTQKNPDELHINDILAADGFTPVEVSGGLAGEKVPENVVFVAAMVETGELPMQSLAEKIKKQTGIFVRIGGREAEMALKGALTTPGSAKPIAIIDMGGGSTDAAMTDERNEVRAVHRAGAGAMVTMMINSELGLEDLDLAEMIKRYPLAKVESLLFLRFEDGTVQYASEPLPAELFARVVVVAGDELIPIKQGKHLSMEKIALVRKEAKRKVFEINGLRALKAVAPHNNIRELKSVILVGGSALDFEIPEMITETLAKYKVTAGRGNTIGQLGARGAVAYGLATL